MGKRLLKYLTMIVKNFIRTSIKVWFWKTFPISNIAFLFLIQGNIYGAQLVIVGGAAILSAIDGNLEFGSRVDKIENYFLHAVIPLKLFYLLSLLIIVQVNHYEQVHSCHYTGIKARSLIQQLRHKHSS